MSHNKSDNQTYRKDGRLVMDPPCALGHTSQAKECPACNDALHPEALAEPAWWTWFARRYRQHQARIIEIKGPKVAGVRAR